MRKLVMKGLRAQHAVVKNLTSFECAVLLHEIFKQLSNPFHERIAETVTRNQRCGDSEFCAPNGAKIIVRVDGSKCQLSIYGYYGDDCLKLQKETHHALRNLFGLRYRLDIIDLFKGED